MLSGVHPLLTGELLYRLDQMGHGDGLVLADAHFPAASSGAKHVLDAAGVGTPHAEAVRTVIPLDTHVAAPLKLMAGANGEVLPVQRELLRAAGVDEPGELGEVFVERFAFYDLAATAFLVVRCGEYRSYGNAWLSKGVVR